MTTADRIGEPLRPQECHSSTILQATSAPGKPALERPGKLRAYASRETEIAAFMYDPATQTLLAVGVDKTAPAKRDRDLAPRQQAPADLDPTTGDSQARYSALSIPVTKGDQAASAMSRTSWPGTPYLAQDAPGVTANGPTRLMAADVCFLEAVGRRIETLTQRGVLAEQTAGADARHAAAEELLTIMAHDLRNCITPLKGHLDLLRRRALHEDDTLNLHDFDAMSAAIARLSGIIDELLDLGRLNRGIFQLARQPLDLVALVRDTAAVMGSPGKMIDLRLPEKLPLKADQARVRQALENLLANALKHSPQGAPVTVEMATRVAEDGSQANIIVSDRGSGIAADVLPHIFTRSGREPGSQGLGLGLYLARGIAEAHGGTLTVESVPGKGASFRLSLPL